MEKGEKSSMATIYDLTEAYATVEEMLYDGEADEQVILDTLQAIDGEIEDKADNYAKLIKNLHSDAESLKSEEERLYQRRKSLENREKLLKSTLQANLEFIGKTKFKTALFTYTVAANGGKAPLSITDNLGDIPGKFLIPQPPKVDTEAVRALLETKEVEWAHLEPRGTSLRIR